MDNDPCLLHPTTCEERVSVGVGKPSSLIATSAMGKQSSAMSQIRKPPAQLRPACTGSGERKPSVGLDGGPRAQLRSTCFFPERMLRQAVEEAAASRSGNCCCLRFWARVCLSSTVAFSGTNVQCLLRQVFACDPELLQDLDSFGSTARSSYLERSVTAQGASVSRGQQPHRVLSKSRRKFHTMPRLGTSPWVELLEQLDVFVQSVLLQSSQLGGMVLTAGCFVILSS